MTKNDVKFCQHVSQYEGKEYMIDLGVVTPSGSISIPFVLYMGEGGVGGSATSLLDIHVSMTFNSSCPIAQNTKLVCYSQRKTRLHRNPLYFVTSIVGTGNREANLNDDYSRHWGVMN